MSLAGWATRFIRRGHLVIHVEGSPPVTCGDGAGPVVQVRITRRAARAVALNPWLKAGEAYVDGELVVEEGRLLDLIGLIARNAALEGPPSPPRRLAFAARRALSGLNDRAASRRHVAHHYDLSADFYRLFLDADLQYSCAYAADPSASLEDWQEAKKAHIAAKLRLRPGDRVLDIGCGWGGLALTLAERWDVEVLGITLSREQLETARARAAARGLARRARFELCDYRDVEGPFDRIVSVGMFEHVGAPNHGVYFEAIARLLSEDGVALVHAIGRKGAPGVTNPWIAKHIFPGGYIPSLSETLASVEPAGLWTTDVEVLRLHYAETLAEWNRRFQSARGRAAALYDERFCRTWEYYLALSEAAFRWGGHMVFQLQLSRSVDALPLTRDYMADDERPPLPAFRPRGVGAAG